MEKTHRILIVDDHTLLRAGLRALLTQDTGIEVVGEADNGLNAIRAVGQLHPHLVLMDLTMPAMNGIEAITEIKRRYFDARVLVMTLHKTEDYIHSSLNELRIVRELELAHPVRLEAMGAPDALDGTDGDAGGPWPSSRRSSASPRWAGRPASGRRSVRRFRPPAA